MSGTVEVCNGFSGFLVFDLYYSSLSNLSLYLSSAERSLSSLSL